MRFIFFLMIASILFSCDQKQNSGLKKILNEQYLSSQNFSVSIDRDTTLITKNGCIIKIPKGSIESDSNNVKLEIKEALTAEDILLSGMTTQSGAQALSSGGMIYFNAASGYNISIKKAIEVLVPTNTYNPDMQIFKGEKGEDEKINWKDPETLPKDSTQQKINSGKRLFNSLCASCHKVYDYFTASALYGITDRRPKKWLYEFTREPYKFLRQPNTSPVDSIREYSLENSDIDPYASCLLKNNTTLMSGFQNLTDESLDDIYGYIKSESNKRPDLKSKFGPTCCDSCEEYHNKVDALEKEKKQMIIENGRFFNLERNIPIPPSPIENEPTINRPPPPPFPYSKVNATSASAVYYTINISAVGWYNIDILMKGQPGIEQSDLFVRLKGEYKIDLTVVLIIPEVKAFVEGGKLKDGKQYGFDHDNGKIPLPQNVSSYILAFGEVNSTLLFGKSKFTTQKNQTIEVVLQETTKERMVTEIKGLDIDGIVPKAEKAKNADKIIETNKKIDQFQYLKPKNCDCDSWPKDFMK